MYTKFPWMEWMVNTSPKIKQSYATVQCNTRRDDKKPMSWSEASDGSCETRPDTENSFEREVTELAIHLHLIGSNKHRAKPWGMFFERATAFNALMFSLLTSVKMSGSGGSESGTGCDFWQTVQTDEEPVSNKHSQYQKDCSRGLCPPALKLLRERCKQTCPPYTNLLKELLEGQCFSPDQSPLLPSPKLISELQQPFFPEL